MGNRSAGSIINLPSQLENVSIYMIGIKGQGMAALAEILSARGARISGSDTKEVFYTDSLLKRAGISFHEEFRREQVPPAVDFVICSAAYDRNTNQELDEARRRNLKILSYPEALGQLSQESDFSGVAGVHGKTTTTAMVGTLFTELDIPITVLVPSEVPSMGNRSTLIKGREFLVAETCEYRRHFLELSPDRLIFTSVEPDHLDYYRDLDDIIEAFVSYAGLLPPGGTLVYCADDSGVCDVVSRLSVDRKDLKLIPYGEKADGEYKIVSVESNKGESRFRLKGFSEDFTLRIPGKHSVSNAGAALALSFDIAETAGKSADFLLQAYGLLASFKGSRRRSEILGRANGVLFMDDFAHHPTAIGKTLQGIRDFHRPHRLIVDFMSHTYSRTQALLGEFATCFTAADAVYLHKIYASARESFVGTITGRDLYNEVVRHHKGAHYTDEPLDAAEEILSELQEGDLFITMGAGDNWILGRHLFGEFSSREIS